jgi:hypothetical protein
VFPLDRRFVYSYLLCWDIIQPESALHIINGVHGGDFFINQWDNSSSQNTNESTINASVAEVWNGEGVGGQQSVDCNNTFLMYKNEQKESKKKRKEMESVPNDSYYYFQDFREMVNAIWRYKDDDGNTEPLQQSEFSINAMQQQFFATTSHAVTELLYVLGGFDGLIQSAGHLPVFGDDIYEQLDDFCKNSL